MQASADSCTGSGFSKYPNIRSYGLRVNFGSALGPAVKALRSGL